MVDKRQHSASISDFSIMKTLGAGSFGIVYLARNKQTEEVVAIK